MNWRARLWGLYILIGLVGIACGVAAPGIVGGGRVLLILGGIVTVWWGRREMRIIARKRMWIEEIERRLIESGKAPSSITQEDIDAVIDSMDFHEEEHGPSEEWETRQANAASGAADALVGELRKKMTKADQEEGDD